MFGLRSSEEKTYDRVVGRCSRLSTSDAVSWGITVVDGVWRALDELSKDPEDPLAQEDLRHGAVALSAISERLTSG